MQGSIYDVMNNLLKQIEKENKGKNAVINGVINVYKEKGYTSHDVVAKLRGI